MKVNIVLVGLIVAIIVIFARFFRYCKGILKRYGAWDKTVAAIKKDFKKFLRRLNKELICPVIAGVIVAIIVRLLLPVEVTTLFVPLPSTSSPTITMESVPTPSGAFDQAEDAGEEPSSPMLTESVPEPSVDIDLAIPVVQPTPIISPSPSLAPTYAPAPEPTSEWAPGYIDEPSNTSFTTTPEPSEEPSAVLDSSAIFVDKSSIYIDYSDISDFGESMGCEHAGPLGPEKTEGVSFYPQFPGFYVIEFDYPEDWDAYAFFDDDAATSMQILGSGSYSLYLESGHKYTIGIATGPQAAECPVRISASFES